MKTLLTILVLAVALVYSQPLSVDSVTVDSVWNSDSLTRTSRDCRVSFIPRGPDSLNAFLNVSSTGGTSFWYPYDKNWWAAGDSAYAPDNAMGARFSCNRKHTIIVRVLGGDRDNFVIRIRIRQPFAWVPEPGRTAAIGYAKNSHPATGLKAVLEELAPKYMPWAVTPGSNAPWSGTTGKGMNTITDWCGGAWDETNRRFMSMGGGHVDMCVTAPYAFDAKTSSWRWLDTPLPTDGFDLLSDRALAPLRSNIAAYYSSQQFDTTEGEWIGDWSGWPAGHGRPGIRQPEVHHMQYGLVWVPGYAWGNTNGALMNLSPAGGRSAGGTFVTRYYFDLDDTLWKHTANFRTDLSTYCGGAVWFGGTVNRVFALTSTSSTLRQVMDVFNPATKTWKASRAAADVNVHYGDGGLGAHLASGLLLKFNSLTAGGVETYAGSVGVRVLAVPAAQVVAGEYDNKQGGTASYTWQRLTVNAVSWPTSYVNNQVEAIGWCYCPRNGKFYATDGRNNTATLWVLNPPAGAVTQNDYLTGTWTVTTETITPGIPNLDGGGNPTGSPYPYNRLVWDDTAGCLLWFATWIESRPIAILPRGI